MNRVSMFGVASLFRTSQHPRPLGQQTCLSMFNGFTSSNSQFVPPAVLGGVRFIAARRSWYWRKTGWWEWRRRIMHAKNKSLHARRHIWPRYEDPLEDPPKKGGGHVWKFKKTGIKFSARRIVDWARLTKGLHLQDAIDWLAAIPVNRLQPIFELLKYAQKQIMNDFQGDPGRLYVQGIEYNYGQPLKYLRYHARGHFGLVRSWRNTIILRVRELPLNEYYHRLYVMAKCPRSLPMDMRVALHEKRVGPEAIREWWPYLTASTRFKHRKNLKWLDCTRQFDYYSTRRDWITRYQANLLRRTNEMRQSRGLAPLAQ
eukprot:GDKI01005252.1.p1 GENE.GDKI01005252.1~~GDKI01005252.1.p1  ORF type:complete len:315 (-),score=60.11 GDKI01005252.1:333-1277(-)